MERLKYNTVSWTQIKSNIREMQHDIVMAVRENDNISSNSVRMLQKKIIKSIEARMMAFRVVITNQGGKTPGIDGVIFKKEDFHNVVNQLRQVRGYKCQPVRRVYIPKAGGGKRKLGIPCSIDRAYQVLFNLALAPIACEINDKRSYGFIHGSSPADAVAYLKLVLNRRNAAPWVIEADISGFFDNISHN